MPQKAKQPNNYAFIDSQNLNLGTQRMGWKMDWRKFREYLRKTYDVSHAYMFIGFMSENIQLYEYMHDLGFLVVLKPTVDVTNPQPTDAGKTDKKAEKGSKAGDEKEKPGIKGNVDADLVLYAMKELPNYDKAIIVSGDGDFLGLVEYLEKQGKLANILTPNWQYSSLFKPYESQIVRLDQLRRQLAYHDRKPKKKQQ
ncbi:MAG TPA: NYN domain-containing protein [Verrucomicrobiae bacterium]|nr:NYN domain-containing protein [Verrucomicrobiae bacterium]